jgi:phenylacetate-CoA ligase
VHRATIIWGVPSFVRRVLQRATERKMDFRSVRMCAISGEASSPALREDMRRSLRELGAAGSAIFDRYGGTEQGAFPQCREEGDWHNPAPEVQYHEAVDPQTGRRLPDGERGPLAVTHLDRRGTVLIRFMIGDVAAIRRDACPACGRSGDRVVGPVVRTKDLVKVKGALINPSVLLEALQSLPGIVEFQVVVQRSDSADLLSADELVVRVAADESRRESIVRAVNEAVRIRPRVEFVPAAEIYQPGVQTKAVRFVDRRA